MMKNYTKLEVELLLDALEDYYDNLQYNNMTNAKLKIEQMRVSKIIGKILKEEECIA
jgi:hypothetical protein